MPIIDPKWPGNPQPNVMFPVATDSTLPENQWYIRDTITGERISPFQSDDHIQVIPFNYPADRVYGPNPMEIDIEAVLALLRGVNQGPISPDPIQTNYLGNVDRNNPPERPIFINFDASAINIYEEDAGGTRHLRFTIPYSKVNAVMVVSNNKMLTPQEAAALDLVTELRNTQASLYETAERMRCVQAGSNLQKDQEISKMQAEKKVLELQYKTTMDNLKRHEQQLIAAEGELAHIKKQIADRQKSIDHLELD